VNHTYERDGVLYRAGRRIWTPAEDAVMRARYPHETTAAVALALNRTAYAINARADTLGLHKSAAYLTSPAAYRLRRGDHVGAAFRFTKGQAPANKGLRRPGWGPGRMKQTQFKAGHGGTNTMPIGSTRLCDGYIYRKISAIPGVWTRNWKLDHFLVWETAHGPVPSGHALAFKNGDQTDVRLANLECITRRELMARNSVHTLPKPLAETIQLLGAITRQIRRRTERHAQKQH
jgi:hypothetical protein